VQGMLRTRQYMCGYKKASNLRPALVCSYPLLRATHTTNVCGEDGCEACSRHTVVRRTFRLRLAPVGLT
jgi:hypothetical protein